MYSEVWDHNISDPRVLPRSTDTVGALDGGSPVSPVDLKKMAMSHVIVAYFPQCHMSNLREGYVYCHYYIIFNPLSYVTIGPMSHVEFKKCPCRPVDFRGQRPYCKVMGVQL